MTTTTHDANDYIPDGELALTDGIQAEQPIASKQKEATVEEPNPPNQAAPLTPPSESERAETPSDAIDEGRAEKDVDVPSNRYRTPEAYPTPTSSTSTQTTTRRHKELVPFGPKESWRK